MKMKLSLTLFIASLVASVMAAPTLNNNLLKRSDNRPALPTGNTASPAVNPYIPGNAQPGASKVDAGGRDIEFNGAALDLVLQIYGNLVNKTILKDPAAPSAQITLQPRQGQELTDEDKISAIETVLEMNGIHLEPYGDKFMRALPRKDARKEGIPLILDPDAVLGETTKTVSFMIYFKNIAIEEAQKALEGLKSNNGILLVFERTNSILVTDTEVNINRMRQIAAEIDVEVPVTEEVFVRQIQNANAQDIKTALDAIVQDSQQEQEKSKAPKNTVTPTPTPVQPSRLGDRLKNPQPQTPSNPALVTAVSDADRGTIRGKVLILSDERSNKLVIVTSKTNMDFFDKVIEQLDVETTPDTVVKVYRLKYADAEDVSDMINDLIGNAQSSKSSSKSNQNQASKNSTTKKSNLSSNTSTGAAKKPANQRSGEAKAGELSKDNTTVLADKRINGLVVMTDKTLVPAIESIIEAMDIKLSQVLIETVIIEVQLGDGIESGIDWISRGREKTTQSVQKTDANGNKLYLKTDTDRWGDTTTYETTEVTDTPIMETITSIARDGFANYYSGGAYSLGGGGLGGTSAANAMTTGVITNFAQQGFNMIWKSDELNLGAILKATETDSRSKYIASPIIMTLDNKEAKIEATQMRYLFKGYQYSGSSMYGTAVPDYEQKDLGITITVTPKINPNGTVMLSIEEEYSQRGGTQAITGQNNESIQAENTVTRKMSADALLENNQTVVFAGLTQTETSETTSGIPILMDIPWIGKWLFSSHTQSEDRSELLVFMTPYVLDDAEAAQAEALRRKQSISDARPWDDHGWSRSELADPVSKHEQLRRLQDSWKVKDEERETSIAIDQAKLERAKHLKELDEEQNGLRALAEEVNGQTLREAEEYLEKNDNK